MLGKTHVTTGIAISVLATQPMNIPELMCSVIGGAIGGDICDIDHNLKTIPIINDNEDDEGTIVGLLFSVGIIIATITLEHFTSNIFLNYCSQFFSYYTISLIVAFGIICLFGAGTSHRGFMHSIVAMVLLSSLLYFGFRPLCFPFFLGSLSHLVLDLTNKKGIQLFFPFKKRVCMNLFPSGGRANNIIAVISTIAALCSIVVILFNCLILNEHSDITDLGKYTLFWGNLKAFTLYLIVVNIVTFILYSLDYIKYYTLDKNDEYWLSLRLHALHALMEILSLAGGIFGQLAVFVFYRIKLGKENAYWIAKILCLIMIWVGIIFLVYDPFNWGVISKNDFKITDHLLLKGYLALINFISFIVFFRDGKKRTSWSKSETGLYLLGLIGGSVGALFAIAITGYNEKSPHFANGFIFFLTAQIFIVLYLLHAGIV